MGDQPPEWDRVSKAYAVYCNPITAPHATDLFQSLYPHLSSLPNTDVTILDLGCGAGASALAYFELFPRGRKGHRLILTDLSSGMVEEAKRNIKHHKFDETDTVVECRVEDATELSSIHDGSVDVVVSLFGVFMIPDQKKVLDEIKRVLKSDKGIFVSCAWTEVSPIPDGFGRGFEDVMWSGAKLFMEDGDGEEKKEEEEDPEWDVWGKADKVPSMLKEHGFNDTSIWKSVHSVPFHGPIHVWNVLKGSPMVNFSKLTTNEIEDKYKTFVKNTFPKVFEDEARQKDMIPVVTASNIIRTSI